MHVALILWGVMIPTPKGRDDSPFLVLHTLPAQSCPYRYSFARLLFDLVGKSPREMILSSATAFTSLATPSPLSTLQTTRGALAAAPPSISFPVSSNSLKAKTWVFPKWVSTRTPGVTWEEPDDGSDSDCEEEEEEKDEWGSQSDNDTGHDSSFPPAKSGQRVDNQYQEFIKEVELLLEPEEKAVLEQNGASVLSKISTRKWVPLHTLALSGQIPFMDKFLEHGVEIDCVDKNGLTALHQAVIGKKEAVISHLLRKGANPHIRDKDGSTPLHYAVQVGAFQTVKLLIKYKVDVNVEDHEGWTPLHVAVQSRCRDIAKVLLINGADKTRRNKDGKTPLDLSLCFGKDFNSYEIAKLVKLVPVNRDP